MPLRKTVEESAGGIEEKVRASLHLAYAMAGTPQTTTTPTTRPRPNSFHIPSHSIPSEPREFGLYNGVSNRARGWKSKTVGEFVDNRAPTHTTVKRWDGATRTWQPWDNLRRDPELWLRDANCYVHLYGVGQSRRGPAFRIPFSALLFAECHPLIDRFLVPVVPSQPQTRPRSMSQPFPACHETNTTRFDLYIPAPRTADTQQAFLFHIATRNFFAWLVRKPLVGKDLGSAMITLLNTMQDLRCPSENNVADLLSYLDSTGYLDMRNQPHFALAVLHLAECFHIRNLYIDAFAHCAGMCDRLFLSPEYQHVSSVSRKLVRRAKNEMDLRIHAAEIMLRSLLDGELSEAHLGLPAGARSHLDRFRSFLRAFYTAKFGYFPPAPVDQNHSAFEPTIFYVMRHDFECLYRFLVDAGFNTADDSPFLATGGICTLQCVGSFDVRHKFASLPQPLPLLPDFAEPVPSRRKSWLGRTDRSRPDYRLLAHAALIQASNMEDVGVLENDLVRSYRKFEEDFIFSCPVKAGKPEKVSQVDARKVRWILIYSIYQTLRSVTEPPPEVRHTQGVHYHLAVGTDFLPPWREDRLSYPPASSHRMSAGPARRRGRAQSMSAASPAWNQRPSQPTRSNTYEIKPDIDYFALVNKSVTTQNTPVNSAPGTPQRSRSLTRGISRSNTVRRSLSIFSKHSRSGSPPPAPENNGPTRPSRRKTPGYHEIVIHGYGNGTQNVTLATEYVAASQHSPNTSPTAANRSLSNASKSSDGSAASAASAATTAATSTTISTVPSSAPSIHGKDSPSNSPVMNRSTSRKTSVAKTTVPELPPRGRTAQLRQEAITIPARTTSSRSSTSSRYSTPPSASPADTLHTFSQASPAPTVPPESRRRHRNTIGGLEDLIHSMPESPNSLHPAPLRIQRDYSNLRVGSSPDQWQEVQHELELRIKREDVKPMWEQFSDLGGLTLLA